MLSSCIIRLLQVLLHFIRYLHLFANYISLSPNDGGGGRGGGGGSLVVVVVVVVVVGAP